MPCGCRNWKHLSAFIRHSHFFLFATQQEHYSRPHQRSEWTGWLWLPAHIHDTKIAKATFLIKLQEFSLLCPMAQTRLKKSYFYSRVTTLHSADMSLLEKKVLQCSLSSAKCTRELHNSGIFTQSAPFRPPLHNKCRTKSTEQMSAEVFVTFIIAFTRLRRRCSGARPARTTSTLNHCSPVIRITCDVTAMSSAEHLPSLHGCENGETGPGNDFTTKEWLHQTKVAGHYTPARE